jgi:hypothetical protein
MPNLERLQSFSTERFLAYEKQIIDTIDREEEARKRALEEARAKKRRSKKKKKKKR